MTITRVTVGSAAYSGVTNLQAAASRLAKLQDQLSSGKRISTPSDDPAGAVRSMQLRSALARNDQYSANADDAQSWLSTADTAYSSIVSTLQQARTLVLKGLNAGVNDASANADMATQMDAIRTTLLSLANTSVGGRPVFGGTTAAGTAYDAGGNYVGDSGVVTREVNDGITVAVSQAGPDVFGPAGGDVFALLQSASDQLKTNPAGMSGLLAQFDTAISRVSAAQAQEGARYQQVDAAKNGLIMRNTAMQTELTGVEDVDLADMAMRVSTANTNYQAALQTTATISQLSLLDFLR
jgi:flagellar hook-associated protein 3 FlgL